MCEKNGNEYVLNGSSRFIFNGTNANYLVIPGKRNPGTSSSIGGLVLLSLKKSKMELKPLDLSDKLGIRASDISEVILEDVMIHQEISLEQKARD